MTALTAARPHPSTFWQWWVLSIRLIAPTLRNGELLTAITASAVITAGLYLPLKNVMGATTGMSSYGQYLTPLIALQAISFASISAAFRAATDSMQGINRRFGSMPIAALTPLTARLSASIYRCSIGLTAAIICGHVIGFRFYGGITHTVGFCVIVLLIGAALSFLSDLIGTSSQNPEATTQWMALPQLIFGLLSVGVQPVEQFPGWIEPIVRNQPVSQFVYALRALAGDTTPAAGSVTWSVMGPSLAWILALMAITGLLSTILLGRRP